MMPTLLRLVASDVVITTSGATSGDKVDTVTNTGFKCIRKFLCYSTFYKNTHHYSDVIMGVMAFQITSLAIVYSTVDSGADQRKHQSCA